MCKEAEWGDVVISSMKVNVVRWKIRQGGLLEYNAVSTLVMYLWCERSKKENKYFRKYLQIYLSYLYWTRLALVNIYMIRYYCRLWPIKCNGVFCVLKNEGVGNQKSFVMRVLQQVIIAQKSLFHNDRVI